VKRIYANWRLKCGENRQLKLTVGETGPKRVKKSVTSHKLDKLVSSGPEVFKTCVAMKFVDDDDDDD